MDSRFRGSSPQPTQMLKTNRALGCRCLPRNSKERPLHKARNVSRLAQGQIGAAHAACTRAVFSGMFF